MKLIAGLVVIAAVALLIACSSDLGPPPARPVQEANHTATATPREAPVVETTPTEVRATAAEPTSASATSAPANSQPEPTDAPDAPTATETPPSPTPAAPVPATKPTSTTGVETPSQTVLRVIMGSIPENLPDYDRDDWKHWTDADGDCQDARNEVLVAESRTAVSYRTDRRCRVAGGEWLTHTRTPS